MGFIWLPEKPNAKGSCQIQLCQVTQVVIFPHQIEVHGCFFESWVRDNMEIAGEKNIQGHSRLDRWGSACFFNESGSQFDEDRGYLKQI